MRLCFACWTTLLYATPFYAIPFSMRCDCHGHGWQLQRWLNSNIKWSTLIIYTCMYLPLTIYLFIVYHISYVQWTCIIILWNDQCAYSRCYSSGAFEASSSLFNVLPAVPGLVPAEEGRTGAAYSLNGETRGCQEFPQSHVFVAFRCSSKGISCRDQKNRLWLNLFQIPYDLSIVWLQHIAENRLI